MRPGRAGTITHDYKRHGTTTFFVALNVLEGKVIGRCMQRHRHQEFLHFLNAIEAAVPVGKVVHVILDLDQRSRPRHRRRQPWEASVRVDPLVHNLRLQIVEVGNVVGLRPQAVGARFLECAVHQMKKLFAVEE